MAAFFTRYLQNKINDLHRRGTAFSYPATSYYSLMVAAPSVDGGGTESPLARVGFANNTTNWGASAAGTSVNLTTITFTSSAPSDLGTIVGIAEYDASSGGNMLTYGDLTPDPIVVVTGASFVVQPSGGEMQFVAGS